jgi:hypothetical protein
MKKICLSLLLLLFLLPGHLFAACTNSTIAANDSEAGSWDSGCNSTNRQGSYAKFFTFTLTSAQAIIINLESAQDAYLFLLSGTGQNGAELDRDNDSGDGKNARITRNLPAGTYTIEATTFASATTGTFTVSLSSMDSTFAACSNYLEHNFNAPGTWVADCPSTHRASSYARYYTFTLSTAEEVIIDLVSSKDTYLYLLAGTDKYGTPIVSDNNSGSGTNSRITRSLSAGSYTIEATTNLTATTGSFTVSVSVASSTPECNYLITVNTDVPGNWNSGCPSAHRAGRYADFYTFTLPSRQDVIIDLKSSQNSYLFLLNGSGQNGTVIGENNNGGAGSNARITITLSAGTYTVEATTDGTAVTGNYVVSVNTSPPSCVDCPFQINAGLNDTWFNPATNGQGMNITVYPVIKQMFVTWFTFDVERPPGDVTAMLGGPGQRWLTAQGPYDDDTANLTIYVTEGGVFDSAMPATSTDQDGDGTLILEFSNCNEGLATYDITSLDISDEIPIERIVLDNVPLCELLAEP